MAQKELTDFDLLRNEIEGGAGNGTNIKSSNGNGGTTSPNPFDLGDMGKEKVFSWKIKVIHKPIRHSVTSSVHFLH